MFKLRGKKIKTLLHSRSSCTDPGIFVNGGRGGGPGLTDRKSSDKVFFSPQCLLQRGLMIYFKEKYHSSRFLGIQLFFNMGVLQRSYHFMGSLQ